MPGTVRRTAAGWVADVSINGVRKTGLRRTKAEALECRRQLLEQLMNKEATPRAKGVSLLTTAEARKISLSTRWAGLASEKAMAIYSRQACDYFGHQFLMKDIDTTMIDSWRLAMRSDGMRPATINKKVSALRSMFIDAEMRGLIDAVPKFPIAMRTRNTKDRTISDQERDGMIRYMQAAGHDAAADLLVFLLETCARWSDAERLLVEDVDLSSGRVHFWRTKNDRSRTVPLTSKAKQALEPHLHGRGRRVFTYSYKQFAALFDAAKDALGLGHDRALTIHTTRHTCASKLASRGIPLQQIMVFGGWTSLSSVQRYLHLSTDALAGCVHALEA